MNKRILVGRKLLDREGIEKITTRIASDLDKKFKDSATLPVIVGVLKGGAPFMCDILRKMKTIVTIDFMSVSSYKGTESSGELEMKMDVSSDIKGRDVVLVDDVVDSGLTTHFLLKYLKETRGAKSITTVFLVDKPARRRYEVPIDYAGMVYAGDDYLIGFGLDYNNLLRNLFGVYELTKKDIETLDRIFDEDAAKAKAEHERESLLEKAREEAGSRVIPLSQAIVPKVKARRRSAGGFRSWGRGAR